MKIEYLGTFGVEYIIIIIMDGGYSESTGMITTIIESEVIYLN